MEAQLWAPNNGHRWASCHGQTWTPTSCPHPVPTPSNNGQPFLSLLDVHLYPFWAPNFVHIGSPHLSIMDDHVCPYWKPISIHDGRPLLPKLEAHLRPCLVSMLVHNGCPLLSMLGDQTHPSWKPIFVHAGCPCLQKWVSKSCQNWTPNTCAWTTEAFPNWVPTLSGGHATLPEMRMPTSWIVDAQFLGWPRGLYASGHPTRNVGAHSCTWPRDMQCVDVRGREWAPIYLRGRTYGKSKKIPHSPKGSEADQLRV